MTVALKLQHGVDNVFKHLRPGYTSLLVDMPDQHHWRSALLGIFQKRRRAFPHLAHTSSHRFKIVGSNSLYGVDNHYSWIAVFYVLKYLLQRRFTNNIALSSVCTKSVSPHLQLLRAFLTRHIEHLSASNAYYVLQNEGRLSDPRLSSY